MTNELEPCPFHKHEAYPSLRNGFYPGDEGYWAELECGECGTYLHTDAHGSEEESIKSIKEMWNTRHKRTCHLIESRHLRGSWPDCSECGGAVQRNSKFCPSCGAEVVDGD